MKLEEFGPQGGASLAPPPLDPPIILTVFKKKSYDFINFQLPKLKL